MCPSVRVQGFVFTKMPVYWAVAFIKWEGHFYHKPARRIQETLANGDQRLQARNWLFCQAVLGLQVLATRILNPFHPVSLEFCIPALRVE